MQYDGLLAQDDLADVTDAMKIEFRDFAEVFQKRIADGHDLILKGLVNLTLVLFHHRGTESTEFVNRSPWPLCLCSFSFAAC